MADRTHSRIRLPGPEVMVSLHSKEDMETLLRREEDTQEAVEHIPNRTRAAAPTTTREWDTGKVRDKHRQAMDKATEANKEVIPTTRQVRRRRIA